MAEVVEWRVFIEEGAAETNKELFEQVDGAMKQGLPVLGEARNDICEPYRTVYSYYDSPLSSKAPTSCFLYLAATDSVGIKHRGQTKLEIKSRGACYKEDVGGASEAYVKVKLGKGADVPAVMDYLRQTGTLTKELEHRLLQPIEVHTAKLVRKGALAGARNAVIIENTGITVASSHPHTRSHPYKWLTYSVEGDRSDVQAFLSSQGAPLTQLAKHPKAVTGGYPTFVAHLAGVL
eukprot:20282-Heterococcus_DN1.PRE.3